jgi:hypothetical protein
MSAAHKSSGAAAAGAQFDSFVAEYAKGVGTKIEQLAELRRQALDAAVQQNRELVTAWQKGTELVVEGYQQSAQIQKDLFAVAVERGRVVSRLTAENVESINRAVAGVTAVLETVAGYATSAQKQAVEFAAAQSTTVYDAAKQQLEASGSAAAETFKRGIDTIIETQRTVLGARDDV